MNQVEVSVVTHYVQAQSDPAEERFVFAYTITITNHGSQQVQLMSRHWIITDASGEVEEVRGEGVVGKQPVLAPGQAFEYTSGAILKTPVGAMQGEYTFVDAQQSPFTVPIEAFSLSMPNLVH
ncbi:MAG: Co2+/Mg2+ efflux protein ApaG [bacterium]